MNDDKTNATEITTILLKAYVAGPLIGELLDWPAEVFDAIMGAIEEREKLDKCKYEVRMSKCDLDEFVTPHRWYVAVAIASSKRITIQ